DPVNTARQDLPPTFPVDMRMVHPLIAGSPYWMEQSLLLSGLLLALLCMVLYDVRKRSRRSNRYQDLANEYCDSDHQTPHPPPADSFQTPASVEGACHVQGPFRVRSQAANAP